MKEFQNKWESFLIAESMSTVNYPFPPINQNQFAIAGYLGLAETESTRADAVSKKVAGDVVAFLKRDLNFEDPDPVDFFETYEIAGLDSDVDVEFSVKIGKTASGKPFSIDSGVYPSTGEYNHLVEIKMDFDARRPIVQSLEDIYFKILEDVRHELEHLIGKMGGAPGNSVFEHYLDKREVPSMVRGLHLRARKMKIPTKVMFKKELEPFVESGELTSEESEQIFQAWVEELDRIQGKLK